MFFVPVLEFSGICPIVFPFTHATMELTNKVSKIQSKFSSVRNPAQTFLISCTIMSNKRGKFFSIHWGL